jgi:hypothetical protein
MKLEFSRQIFSAKSVQWEPSCSMRAGGRTDGQTDMAKFTVAFRNFSNSPKKGAFRRQVAPANFSMITSYNAADIKAVGRHTLLSETTITMYH